MAGAILSSNGVLIDSDVLIWFMRGHPKAVAALEAAGDWNISAASYMELIQGCRNKAEVRAVQKALKSADDGVLPVTQGISDLACTLVEKYSLSHSVHLADGLIAATAVHHGLTLLTANIRHFLAIDALKIKPFKP